jgi:hypothetical protein
MRRFLRLIGAGAVISGSLIGPGAQAQPPFPYAAGGYGGWGMSGLPYNYFQSQQELPFYAKFPPVYYSYPPIPRSYGYSPFAYPPGTRTPEIEVAAAPLEIINPYAPESIPAPSPSNAAPASPAAPTPSAPALPTPSPPRPNARGPADESVTGIPTLRRTRAAGRPQPLVIVNPYVIDAIAADSTPPDAAALAR